MIIALLLSVGINAGLLAAVVARRVRAEHERPPREEPPPPEMEPQGGGGGDALPKVRRLADHLGLEGEQRRQFLEIQLRFFSDALSRRLQLAETRRDLRRELTGAHPDDARIQALLRSASGESLALEQALVRNVLETRRLLTPEQDREYLQIVRRLGPIDLAQPAPREPRPEPPGAREDQGGGGRRGAGPRGGAAMRDPRGVEDGAGPPPDFRRRPNPRRRPFLWRQWLRGGGPPPNRRERPPGPPPDDRPPQDGPP
jgi:Spy/CpxP family protein refolding chaperone